MLYCWKELDWGGDRTCHVHPDGSVLHGESCCHLQEEKVVTAKAFSLRPVANPVNVSKSEKDVPH